MVMKHLQFIVLLFVGIVWSACSSHDAKRVEQADLLLHTHPDSAALLLREVTQPEKLIEDKRALYWLLVCDMRANAQQSLSEDSMICWAAEYYRGEWEKTQTPLAAERMMRSGLDEALYWWWSGNREQAWQVLQRQRDCADEVATATGEHVWQMLMLRVSVEIAMLDYDYARARDYTEELIRLNDEKFICLDAVGRIYNGLAIAYYSLGDYAKMEECFEQAIAQETDSATVWFLIRRNYADLLGETGQYDRAIRMHEELVDYYKAAGAGVIIDSYYQLSCLWLMKGNKQLAAHYYRLAESVLSEHPEMEQKVSVRGELLAQRQVLDYALTGHYNMMPQIQFNNRWEERDYMRYRVAEARERRMHDLRERNLRLTLSRQRAVFAGIIALLLGVAIVLILVILYKKRRRTLLEKEEEIETLRSLLAEKKTRTDEDIRRMMLQQLGVIRALAENPTEANQKMLGRLLQMDEKSADALLNWQMLYHTIDLGYEGFYTYLSSHYGDVLNAREIQLCCLLRAGFSTKETNMLTRQSMQTIYQRKSQIRAKLHLQEGEDIIPFLTKLQQ